SARSPVPQNAPPATEYPLSARATAAAPKGKHKFDETSPAGISPRVPALPDPDASPPPPAHPHSPAYRRQCAQLLLLPARAATWLASPKAYRQSRPERWCHDPPARTFQYAGPPLL